MHTLRTHLTLMLLLLGLSLLGSCCLSGIFDDDNINPDPHNEGNAGDV